MDIKLDIEKLDIRSKRKKYVFSMVNRLAAQPLKEKDYPKDLNYIHTYIISHYNPSVRIINLVSHTSYLVCVNFIHKRRGPTV